MHLQKVISKKILEKNNYFLFGLEVAAEKIRILSRSRICTKMSQIRNTGFQGLF
jgi:hypothetical protein